MKWYESYLFIIGAGFIGYCIASVTGFVIGGLWALLVVLILSLFGNREV